MVRTKATKDGKHRGRPPSGEVKRIVGYKLTDAVIDAIRDEANALHCWPAHVVEDMARKRYGLPQINRLGRRSSDANRPCSRSPAATTS